MAETAAPRQGAKAATGAESIYQLHAAGLRSRCLRITGDPARADDLMQEVFARFLARFPHPPPDMNVHGYLLATARNVWINQTRTERAVAIDRLDDAGTPDDRIENDPVRSLLLAEQQLHVRRGAAALPERQRRALTLRELAGRSYAEIGTDLHLSSNAVAQIVWRARGHLRRSIRRAQVDVDRIPPDCRALLDEMSDLVDRTPSRRAAELEAHVTECATCRTTLASYQEAASSFRGALPLLPVLALTSRVGLLLRASIEAPAAVRKAAAISAAVVATAGGGGAFVAHYTAYSMLQATSRSARGPVRAHAHAGATPAAEAPGEAPEARSATQPDAEATATDETSGPTDESPGPALATNHGEPDDEAASPSSAAHPGSDPPGAGGSGDGRSPGIS